MIVDDGSRPEVDSLTNKGWNLDLKQHALQYVVDVNVYFSKIAVFETGSVVVSFASISPVLMVHITLAVIHVQPIGHLRTSTHFLFYVLYKWFNSRCYGPLAGPGIYVSPARTRLETARVQCLPTEARTVCDLQNAFATQGGNPFQPPGQTISAPPLTTSAPPSTTSASPPSNGEVPFPSP